MNKILYLSNRLEWIVVIVLKKGKSMDNREVLLQNFTKDVKKILGDAVEKIILYGSYARGDFQENSDLDIMILTSLQENNIKKMEDKLYDLAFDYLMSDSVVISIHVKNIDQFNYWLGALPYYDNIEKEGIILAG